MTVTLLALWTLAALIYFDPLQNSKAVRRQKKVDRPVDMRSIISAFRAEKKLRSLMRLIVPEYLASKVSITDSDVNEYVTRKANNKFGLSLTFCGLTAAEKQEAQQSVITELRVTVRVPDLRQARIQLRWSDGSFDCEDGEQRSKIMHISAV